MMGSSCLGRARESSHGGQLVLCDEVTSRGWLGMRRRLLELGVGHDLSGLAEPMERDHAEVIGPPGLRLGDSSWVTFVAYNWADGGPAKGPNNGPKWARALGPQK